MRKFITSIAVIAMAAAMMTGCGSADKKTTTAACLLYTSPSPRDTR